MSYSPINQAVFIRAYVGALAGMGITNRDINELSTVPNAFASECAIATAFAQQFDTQLNSSGLSALGVLLVQTLSQEYWSGRQPSNNVVFRNPLTYENAVAVLIAAIAGSFQSFAASGTPQTDPGTAPAAPAGGSIVSLQSMKVGVDQNVTGPPTFRQMFPPIHIANVNPGDIVVVSGFGSFFAQVSASADFQLAVGNGTPGFAAGNVNSVQRGALCSCDCRSPLQHYQEAFVQVFPFTLSWFDIYVTSQWRNNNSENMVLDAASLITVTQYRGLA